MAQSENAAAIERAVEQMNSGNVEDYLDLYSDNLTLHGYPPGIEGKEGATAFYTAFRKGVDPFHLTIEDMIEDGDKVAGRYSIRGSTRTSSWACRRPATTSTSPVSRSSGSRTAELSSAGKHSTACRS